MRAYTMANDRMAENFERFLTYFRATNPGRALFVIPFNDDTAKIEATIAAHQGNPVTLIPTDPQIDAMGLRVFEDENYRPGIPMWRYMRKLNAFFGHEERFTFMDCNALALYDLSRLEAELTADKPLPDALFGSNSSPNRTLRHEEERVALNRLSPGLKTGYGCAFFLSRGGWLRKLVLDTLCHRNLRRWIGRSPEQGVLATYLAMTGASHGTITAQNPAFATIQSEALHYDTTEGVLRAATGARKGRIKVSMSFTGQDLVDEGSEIRRFLTAVTDGGLGAEEERATILMSEA